MPVSIPDVSKHIASQVWTESRFETESCQIKKPRLCRVSPGFEPASAGGSLPRNAALAQAYRVIPIKLRTLLICIGSKREGDITNTEGLSVLYHTHGCRGR